MPSRPAVAAILLFWLGTTAYAVHRDLWPRLFPSGPPPVAMDLQDEATQFAEVRWTVSRGDKKVGRLTTAVKHVDTDDTVLFTQTYTNVEVEVAGARFQAARLRTTTRVTRGGHLREQTMDGDLRAVARGLDVTATATVTGRVENGLFVGTCDIRSSLGDLSRPLDPVPVPDGQVLNPLTVMNRMPDLRPGQSWHVKEVNPLRDAGLMMANELLGKFGLRLPEAKQETIVARVLSDPQSLPWKGGEADCWVVEYAADKATVRTWVRRADGKVLKQEAYGMGERLVVEREE
jgi:hypothetical protein